MHFQCARFHFFWASLQVIATSCTSFTLKCVFRFWNTTHQKIPKWDSRSSYVSGVNSSSSGQMLFVYSKSKAVTFDNLCIRLSLYKTHIFSGKKMLFILIAYCFRIISVSLLVLRFQYYDTDTMISTLYTLLRLFAVMMLHVHLRGGL